MNRKKLSRWILGLLIFAFFLLLGLAYLAVKMSGPTPRDFDAITWRSHPFHLGLRDETRLSMVDDLVQSRILIGKTKDEVQAVLGEPSDEPEYFRDWDMKYLLGPERGFFRIDSEWLLIKLTDHNVVREVQIGRD